MVQQGGALTDKNFAKACAAQPQVSDKCLPQPRKLEIHQPTINHNVYQQKRSFGAAFFVKTKSPADLPKKFLKIVTQHSDKCVKTSKNEYKSSAKERHAQEKHGRISLTELLASIGIFGILTAFNAAFSKKPTKMTKGGSIGCCDYPHNHQRLYRCHRRTTYKMG